MKKLNLHISRGFLGIFLFSIIASIAIPLVTVHAQNVDIDVKTIAAYDVMKQWPRQSDGTEFVDSSSTQCSTFEFNRGDNGKAGFAKKIRQGDLDNSAFYGYFQGPLGSVSDILVGKAIEKQAGESDANGRLGCQNAFKFITRTLFGNQRDVLEAFYNLDSKDSSNEYSARDHGGDSQGEFLNKEINKWTAKLESDPRFADSISIYKKEGALLLFKGCFNVKDGRKDDYDKYDIDNYEERKDDANTNAGYILETAIQGNYTDGKVDCTDVFNYVKANRLLDDNVIGDEEQRLRAEAIRNKIKENPDYVNLLYACVGSVSAGLASESADYVLGIISNWLATDEGKGPITYTNSSTGNPSQISAPDAQKIKECLFKKDVFGPELAEIVGAELTSTPVDPSAEDEPKDSCYESVTPLFKLPGGISIPNPLKWAVCGISQLLAGLIDSATETVYTMLKFNPTDGASSLRVVWTAVLRVANTVFIIAFLVVVISTALDMGIFSNYTVKKMIPRIILAAILANLSWEICRVLFEITNAIGGATRDVILSPLKDLTASTGNPDSKSVGEAAKSLFMRESLAVGAGIGALIYASIASAGAILLPVMATVAIAVIIALVVLLLRQIILILLVVAAPLALAAMALPGGDKLSRKWWKLFSSLLLMYPMIAALFASGIFISSILEPTSDGLIDSAIQIIVLFLPFFMLPVLFKAAGGAIANVTGMINDRGKGLIDRSKNYRDNSSQYGRRKKFKAASREQRGQQELFESLQGDSKRAQYRRHQAFGMKGLTAKSRERSDVTRSSMLGQTDEAIHKQQVQGIINDVSQMEQPDAKAYLKARALDTTRSDAERAAALSAMAQYKDVNGIDEVQESMRKEGPAGVKTWNKALQKNFAEYKAISPHLATDLREGDSQGALQARHQTAFDTAPEQNLAGMKAEGWQKYQSLNPAAASQKAAEIKSNPILRGAMPSDAASYYLDTPTVTTDPSTGGPVSNLAAAAQHAQAGALVGQTMLSSEKKTQDWLEAMPRHDRAVAGAHAGVSAKLAEARTASAASPGDTKATEKVANLEAAQAAIESEATKRGMTL